MNLHPKQDALPKGRQPLKPTVAPPSPPRRSALAIAMLLWSLVAVSRAQSPLPDRFNPGADGGVVYSLAVQADGKTLMGGEFTTLGGQPRGRDWPVHPDGSLDSPFNPWANSQVNSLAVQADGKILVGGYFTTLGGQPRNRIGRLNPDGTIDPTFNPGAGLARRPRKPHGKPWNSFRE